MGKALLPLLEQTDRAGVVIGYRFYQCCETGELTVDTLRGLLRQRTIESGSRLVTKEEIERAAVLDSFFNEEEEPENMPLGKRIKAWFSGKKKKREERKKRKKPLFDKEFKDVYNTNTEPEQTGSEYVDTAFGENSNTVFQQIPDTSLRQQSGDPETMLLTPDMLIPQDEQTWVLKIKEKHEEEREILLTKEVYLVGKTGSGVNLQLASSTVSRLHAKLEKNGENWLINDINSKNGTKIIRQTPDGQRESLLQPGETVILKEGDVIWFADIMCVMTRR